MLDVSSATPQDIWSARLLVKMNNQDGVETPENIAEIARLPLPDIGTPERPGPDHARNRRVHGLDAPRRSQSEARPAQKRAMVNEYRWASKTQVSQPPTSRDEYDRVTAQIAGTVDGPLTVEEVNHLTALLSDDLLNELLVHRLSEAPAAAAAVKAQVEAIQESMAARVLTTLPRPVLERALEMMREQQPVDDADDGLQYEASVPAPAASERPSSV